MGQVSASRTDDLVTLSRESPRFVPTRILKQLKLYLPTEVNDQVSGRLGDLRGHDSETSSGYQNPLRSINRLRQTELVSVIF